MGVLVAGPGSEDARQPLWQLTAWIQRQGYRVAPYDHVVAAESAPGLDPMFQAEWLLNAVNAGIVVLVDHPAYRSGHDRLAQLAAARSIPVAAVNLPGVSVPGEPTGRWLPMVVDTEMLKPVAPPLGISHCDVLVGGRATDIRVAAARSLSQAGLRVAAWGLGWDEVPELAHFTGGAIPYPERAAAYAATDLVLALGQPDDPFGSCLVALEAAACGRPVLAAVGEGADRLFDPETEIALLAPNGSDRDLVDSTVGLLADPARRQALGQAGRRRADADYGFASIWVDLLEPGREMGSSAQAQITAVRDIRPRVTVHLPTYQVAEYLGPAIESVLDQSYSDFELLITDDGSTDGTTAVIEKYTGDSRVRVRHQANIGQTGRFDTLHNRVIAEARGDLFVHTAADDICDRDRLALQVARFDADPGVDIISSGGIALDPNGVRGASIWELRESYTRWSLARCLMAHNVAAHPSVMLRRNCFERVGGYEQGFASDYHFWFKASKSLRFLYIPKRLMAYRFHPKSASTSESGARRSEGEALRVGRLMRATFTIGDFYPELGRLPGDRDAAAAAHTDLGNRFLTGILDPEMALREYQKGIAVIGEHPALIHNAAVACLYGGDRGGASSLLAARPAGSARWPYTVPGALAGPLRALLARSELALPKATQLLAPASDISPALFAVAPTADDDVWDWSGNCRGPLRRALLAVDWNAPDRLRSILETWCRLFRRHHAVQLVLLQDGVSLPAAGEAVSRALAGAADLAGAGEINLGEIDDTCLIPPGHFELIADMRGASYHGSLYQVMSWMFAVATEVGVEQPSLALA